MIDIDAELLDLDAGWREVLEAYQLVEEAGPGVAAEDPYDDGAEEADEVVLALADLPAEDERNDWLPRVEVLEGIDDERLSSLHGRLIALGWLGFEVGDRTTGMRYRITRDGQRVLDGIVPIPTLQVVGVAGDEEPAAVAPDSESRDEEFLAPADA